MRIPSELERVCEEEGERKKLTPYEKRTWLVNYLIHKNSILRKYSNLTLTNDADLAELISWDDQTIINTYATIRRRLKMIQNEQIILTKGADGFLCPWCVIHDGCTACNYRARHGNCNVERSHYRKIVAHTSAYCIAEALVPHIQELLELSSNPPTPRKEEN